MTPGMIAGTLASTAGAEKGDAVLIVAGRRSVVAASLGAIAIVASAGLTMIAPGDSTVAADQAQITMAGDVYSVGE